MIVCSTVYVAAELANKLDKLIELFGAILCAPIALTMPALCHFKIVAKT